MMADVFHGAFCRIPVGMYVEWRHEYGKHDGFRFKIFRLIHFLNSHYFSVNRAYYHIFAWSGIMSQWTTEEVEHEKIHDYGNGREYCRDDVWRHEEPHGNIQNPEHKEKQYKDVGAFSMYLHFIIEIFRLWLAVVLPRVCEGENGN